MGLIRWRTTRIDLWDNTVIPARERKNHPFIFSRSLKSERSGNLSFPNAELGSLCRAQEMHDENMSGGSERPPIAICTEDTDSERAIYPTRFCGR